MEQNREAAMIHVSVTQLISQQAASLQNYNRRNTRTSTIIVVLLCDENWTKIVYIESRFLALEYPVALIVP